LKRPEVRLRHLKEVDDLQILTEWQDDSWAAVREQVEIEIKYEGFIQRQNQQADKLEQLEARVIPKTFDFSAVAALSAEAREKLNEIRPETVGQASRISGVSPADISVLLIYLSKANVSRETLTHESRQGSV
jgi:tRNA uridine 5-carboxymethylaminomethyl modification enzyme